MYLLYTAQNALFLSEPFCAVLLMYLFCTRRRRKKNNLKMLFFNDGRSPLNEKTSDSEVIEFSGRVTEASLRRSKRRKKNNLKMLFFNDGRSPLNEKTSDSEVIEFSGRVTEASQRRSKRNPPSYLLRYPSFLSAYLIHRAKRSCKV